MSFIEQIVEAGRRIGKWSAEIEYGAGSLCWSKLDCDVYVYASPFWECEPGISVSIMRDGVVLGYFNIPLADDSGVDDYMRALEARWPEIERMMAVPTAGAWSVHLPTDSDRRLLVLAPDGERVIARMDEGYSTTSDPERLANAYLIAAAPALAAALRSFAVVPCDCNAMTGKCIHQVGREALALAQVPS